MDDKEAIQMMQRCVHELRDLRRQRDALAPKAEAYDVLQTVVSLLPRPSQGMSEDIVWVLEKRIKELEPKPEAKVPVKIDE